MSGDAGKPVLLFLQRETKANGQFGKLKQLNIRPYEVEPARRPRKTPRFSISCWAITTWKATSLTTVTRRPASRRPCCPRTCSSSSCPSWRPRSGWRGSRTARIISRSSTTFGRWPGTTGRRGGSASTSRPTTRGSAGSSAASCIAQAATKPCPCKRRGRSSSRASCSWKIALRRWRRADRRG